MENAREHTVFTLGKLNRMPGERCHKPVLFIERVVSLAPDMSDEEIGRDTGGGQQQQNGKHLGERGFGKGILHLRHMRQRR